MLFNSMFNNLLNSWTQGQKVTELIMHIGIAYDLEDFRESLEKSH